MTLSAGDQTTLRTGHPHAKKPKLSVVPTVALLQARVNDAGILVGEESIVYDSGTGSAARYALIKEGQTLLVGTTAGDDDLGRIRVLSITGNQTSGTITVAWNSDVRWTNNAYLTVIHFYEVWPKFPRFTVSPEVFYKDKTITYTDQNTDQYPVARHLPFAGELSGGTKVVVLNGTDSYTLAQSATISTYLWEVESIASVAAVITSSGASSTTITYSEAELYWVVLTITDSNGKTQTCKMPHVIQDENNPPFLIETAVRSESWSGRCSLSFTTREAADESVIPRRTAVILWSENTYDASLNDISGLGGGRYIMREHIDYFGYVLKANPTIETQTGLGTTEFSCKTALEMLGDKFEYPVSLIAHPNVTAGLVDAWWKFPSNRLTVARAIHHLWRWHSTLFEVCAVGLPTSDTKVRAGVEDFSEGSLLERARSFCLDGSIFANLGTNRFGEVIVEVDYQMFDDSTRAAFSDLITLADTDRRGEVSIVVQDEFKVADARINAGFWNGNIFATFCSKWGTVAANDGSGFPTKDNIMVATQAEANTLVGRMVAIGNNPILEITLEFAGNYASVFTTVPQEWTRFSLTGSEPGNKRGTVLDNIRALPRQIETSFGESGLTTTRVSFEIEAFGRDGISIDCQGYPIGSPGPSTVRIEDPENALMAFSAAGAYFREDSDSDWSNPQTEDYIFGLIDPFWEIKQSSDDPKRLHWLTMDNDTPQEEYIERVVGTPSEISPPTDPPDSWADTVDPTLAALTKIQILSDGWQEDVFFKLYRWQGDASNWRGWLARTDDAGATYTWTPLFDGSAPTELYPIRMDSNGTNILITTYRDSVLSLHIRNAVTLAFVSETSLGAATLANVTDRALVAYPRAVLDNDAVWFLFGRMSSPGGLSGIHHIIKTVNTGSTYANVINDWATQICSTLAVSLDLGSESRNLWCTKQDAIVEGG